MGLRLIKEGSFYKFKGHYPSRRDKWLKAIDEEGGEHWVRKKGHLIDRDIEESYAESGFYLKKFVFDALNGSGRVCALKRPFGIREDYLTEEMSFESTHFMTALVTCLFEDGLLDERIKKVSIQKLTDNTLVGVNYSGTYGSSSPKKVIEYARKYGVFRFMLFKYGYNNAVYYDIDTKDVFINPENYNLNAFDRIFKELNIDLSTEKGQLDAAETMLLEINPRSPELQLVTI